jgi:uncharacterized protein YndB with AHSA1/START domain
MVQFLPLLEGKLILGNLGPFMNRFKPSQSTYSIGGKIYQGKVNQHQTFIGREPERVYHVLIDPGQLRRWCPFEEISIQKITPGEFHIGTRLHFKLHFRIRPEWDTEVLFLEKPGRIIYRFLSGIFEGGIEVWDLKKVPLGTEVTHTLLYRIDRWVYKVGWYLLGGEKKHNELTERALSGLKSLVEGTSS